MEHFRGTFASSWNIFARVILRPSRNSTGPGPVNEIESQLQLDYIKKGATLYSAAPELYNAILRTIYADVDGTHINSQPSEWIEYAMQCFGTLRQCNEISLIHFCERIM